jgi:hypothetical protein
MFDLVGKAANNRYLPLIVCPHSQSMFQILPPAKSLSLLFNIASSLENAGFEAIPRQCPNQPHFCRLSSCKSIYSLLFLSCGFVVAAG